MAIIGRETFSGIGLNVNLENRVLDNVGGGSGTRTWQATLVGGNSMRSHGTIANRAMGGATNAGSSFDDANAKVLTMVLYPRTDNTFPALSLHARATRSDVTQPRLKARLHTSATRFDLGSEVSGSFTSRASQTIVNPAEPVVIQFNYGDPTAVVATLRKLSDNSLIATNTYNFGSLPPGTWHGFGMEQGGLGESWGVLEIEDAPTQPNPVLTSPTGTATGSQTASGTVTTDTAVGTLYAALSATDLTASAIIAANNSQVITTAGAKSFTFSGATPGATGVKTQFVHVRPTGEQSAVSRSAAFNLNTPLPAPDTTVVTTIGTHTVSGVDHLAIVLTGVATNTANVSASMPAASPANGATTRPAQSVAPDGSGNWVIRFLDPPAGDYDFASILLSNADHPSVAKSGDKKVQILPIGGEAPGPGGDPEADTENPVMTGSLSSSNLTSTSYDITGYGATDNVGVAGYERSLDAGSTWLSVAGATTFSVSGRTPGATDQVRVRAFDFAGNRAATPLSLAVTLAAAPDTTAPVMQGTISLASLTSTSYTTGVDAATDNVAVTGYRVSQDGGSTWIDKGTDRTHNHTGRTPGATDQVRWSARDAAGNWATPLSRAVTLAAAPDTTAPVMTGSIAVSAKTSSSYTLTWQAATDAVGVTGYEYSLNGGTNYTDAGLVLTVNVTGRAAESTDQVRVRAYDAAGNRATPLSVAVTLDAVPAPTINTQPASSTIADGATASMSVAATGPGSLSYQWLSRAAGDNGAGTDVSGATSASYTTPALTAASSGRQYRVRVRNTVAGSFTDTLSNWATVTVATLPAFTTHPANATVTEGSAASLTWAASGTAPITFMVQMRANSGAAWSDVGTSSSPFSTGNLPLSANGRQYSILATGPAGSPVRSNVATMTVNAAIVEPTWTTQPTNESALEGGSALFEYAVSGTAPITVQAQRRANSAASWVNVAGATATSYETPDLVLGDNGYEYSFLATGPSTTPVRSAIVTLTVTEDVVAVAITTQPTNQTAEAGQTATFIVVATGTGPLAYQWTRGGMPISGATGATYVTATLGLSDDDAEFAVEVTGASGTVTSNTVTLTVTPAVTVPDTPATVLGVSVGTWLTSLRRRRRS